MNAKSAKQQLTLVSEDQPEETEGKPAKPAKRKSAKLVKPQSDTVTLDKSDLQDLQEAEDILSRIEKQEELCGRLALDVEDATETLKAKKGNYQAQVLALREMCRLRREEHPLFDGKPAAVNVRDRVKVEIFDGPHEGQTVPVWSVAPEGVYVLIAGQSEFLLKDQYECDAESFDLITRARDAGAVGSVFAWEEFLKGELAEQGDKNAWRKYTLSHLGIDARLQAHLENAGLNTLGSLAGSMNRDGAWWHQDIKGIGTKAAEEISERFAGFWSLHPEFCGS